MLQQTLSLSTFILLIWLIFMDANPDQQVSNQLSSLQNQLNAQAEQNKQAQAIINKQLQAINSFVEQQNMAEQQAQQALAQVNQQKQITDLYKVYTNLLLTEQMRQAGQLSEAAELLKAQKDIIWQSGDRYPEHKERLQGLMQPIDEGSQQWQNGNAEHRLGDVANTIRDVIGNITP
jgi:anion-transporting  ArsA/GET3 family ATPase